MKIDKQSNVYIIIYIIIVVVIVGTALAFTSMSLRPRQQENIAADKMKQILASVHVVPAPGEVKADYERYIVDSYVVDAAGDCLYDSHNAFDVDVAKEVKEPAGRRVLPVFVARMADGALKYILPVYGAGLWGPIWGYVALDSDGSTIFGAFFSHQGETPGLGAEITKPAFTDQFEGKNLFPGGHFFPVEVVKTGQQPTPGADYVDAISGGTVTSKGVGAMLDNCLRPYQPFLNTLRTNIPTDK